MNKINSEFVLRKEVALGLTLLAVAGTPEVASAASSSDNHNKVCYTYNAQGENDNSSQTICNYYAGARLVKRTVDSVDLTSTQTTTQNSNGTETVKTTEDNKTTDETLRYSRHGKHHVISKVVFSTDHKVVNVVTQPENPTITQPTSMPTTTLPTTTTPAPYSVTNCQTASYTAESSYYDQGNEYKGGYTFTVDANWCDANGQIVSDTINYSTNIPAGDGFNPQESVTPNASNTELDLSAFGSFNAQNPNTGVYITEEVGLSGQLNADGTSTFATISSNGG